MFVCLSGLRLTTESHTHTYLYIRWYSILVYINRTECNKSSRRAFRSSALVKRQPRAKHIRSIYVLFLCTRFSRRRLFVVSISDICVWYTREVGATLLFYGLTLFERMSARCILSWCIHTYVVYNIILYIITNRAVVCESFCTSILCTLLRKSSARMKKRNLSAITVIIIIL